MSTSTSVRVCSQCGAALPLSAPEGLCPRCVFASLGQNSLALDQTGAVTLSGVTPESSAQSPIANGIAQIFGDYHLLEEIARGGMGVVYKARQISLNRTVALKMILAGEFAAKELTRRFQGEATAAALLQHPNIVAVHEVGVHQGHHFFSMDYVQGQNLAQLVGTRPLPPHQAARYLKSIAQAIHYAHAQGILHRDLKPSNVLVDAATDQPRVTDFGLARRLEGDSSLTVSGQVLGSPHFLPPEQASGSRGKVGRHSDVFGLGAILYYLLTARAPFQGESLETILEQVLHVEPVSPRLLNPGVSLDLETICLKCLEKEPARRYGSAGEVAQELERYLRDEPIVARPVGRMEKGWRWCRRNPVVAGLSGATLLLLLAVAIGGPIAALRIAHGRQEAESAGNLAKARSADLEENVYFNRIALAYGKIRDNKPVAAQKLLADCPKALRNWEWDYLWRVCHVSTPDPVRLSDRAVSLAISTNGRDVAVAVGQELQLWVLDPSGRLTQQQKLGPAQATGLENAVEVAFNADGTLLAAAGTNQTVQIWRVANRTLVQTFSGCKDLVNALAFHPSGRAVAAAGYDRYIRIWDVDTRQEQLLSGRDVRGINGLAYSPDGHWLAAGSFGPHLLQVWNLRTRQPMAEFPEQLEPIDCIQFSSDGGMLASGSGDGTISIWAVQSGKRIALLDRHNGLVTSVAFNRSGSRLISASTDREVKIWDVKTQREVLSLLGHKDNVTVGAFTPDQRRLISGSFDRTLRVWDASPWDESSAPKPEVLAGHSNRVYAVAFTQDGRLLSACEDSTGLVWDLTLRKPTRSFWSRYSVSASASGRYIVSVSNPRSGGRSHVALLDAGLLQEQFVTPPSGPVFICAALSADDQYLVTGGEDSQVTLWDWQNRRSAVLWTSTSSIHDLKFSPGGEYLAALSENGEIRVWTTALLLTAKGGQAPLGRTLLSPNGSREFGRIAFSPDGAWLASGDGASGIIVLDVGTGQPVFHNRSAHGGIVLSVAFSPDGQLLASTATDATVRLWNGKTGEPVGTLFGHTALVNALAFSPDGRLLASGSQDQTIRLWSISDISAREPGQGRVPHL